MWQTSIWSGAYNAMMIALSGAPPAADPEGAWLEIWEEHLANNKPWLDTWLRNQVDGPVWHEGSVRYGLENIQAATFIIGGWYDIFVSRPVPHVHEPAPGRAEEADDGSIPVTSLHRTTSAPPGSVLTTCTRSSGGSIST